MDTVGPYRIVSELGSDAIHQDTPSARAFNPALPQGVDDVLARDLEKNPALRHQTASDLRVDLQRLRRNLDTQRTSCTSVTTAIVPPPSSGQVSPAAVATRAPRLPRAWIGVVVIAIAAAAIPSVMCLRERARRWTPRQNRRRTSRSPGRDGRARSIS